MRLEAAVRTGLRFHSDSPGFAPPLDDLFRDRATTVGIKFSGRLFVWHEFPPSPPHPPFPAYVYGPTISVVYTGSRDEAANDLARFISALVFHYEVFLDPAAPFFLSGSGESDDFHPASVRELRHFEATYTQSAPEEVESQADPRLAVALAVYREGVNATSPYFGFFAFWSVLDAVFDGDATVVDAYVNAQAAATTGGLEEYAQRVLPKWTRSPSTDVATYLREHGRNAIGHVIRDRPHAPQVNPDDNATRHRLAAEGYWLRAAAKRAILSGWTDPVRVIERV